MKDAVLMLGPHRPAQAALGDPAEASGWVKIPQFKGDMLLATIL